MSIRSQDADSSQQRRAIAPSRGLILLGVVVGLAFPTVVTLAYFVFVDPDAPSVQQTRYGWLKCLQFAFPVFWVWLVLRERLACRRPRGMGLGLAFGLATLLAMLGIYFGQLRSTEMFAAAALLVDAKLADLGIDSLGMYVAVSLFYSLIHSFLEEYYWRWFVFAQLRRLVELWPAIVVSAMGFAAHHVVVLGHFFGWMSWATWLFTLAIIVGGGFWAWLFHKTNSLYGPWLSHLLVDAGIFWIGFDLVAGLNAG